MTVLCRFHLLTCHIGQLYTFQSLLCTSMKTIGKQSQNLDILGNLEIQARTCPKKKEKVKNSMYGHPIITDTDYLQVYVAITDMHN